MEKGIFSTGLKAIQLQLQTMLDGVGGEQTAQLLDGIADLGTKEREVVLELFCELVQKIKAGERRFFTDEDIHQQDLIDSLYEEVMSQLYGAHVLSAVTSKPRTLSAVPSDDSLIDLGEYRAAKERKKDSCSL
jgi:hypothetical protein